MYKYMRDITLIPKAYERKQ